MAELLNSRVSLDTVPGWFFATDRTLFRWMLGHQSDLGVVGDLVELGTYFGKSAIVMGDYLAPGETLTVLDLFESEGADTSNAAENQASYADLTRLGFEEHFLRFHPELPRIVVGLSSSILDVVVEGSARFVHIDASHLYEHVVGDAQAARVMLQPDGVVVFDDYRSPHTPGVAAAVWDAVLHGGLNPICISESKLYGTWGTTEPLQASLVRRIDSDPHAWYEFDDVAGHRIVRCTFAG
jgi:hypothetical protein